MTHQQDRQIRTYRFNLLQIQLFLGGDTFRDSLYMTRDVSHLAQDLKRASSL